MKNISKLYNLLLLLSCPFFAHAQDFAKADSTVKAYPAFSDIDTLAAQINADFTTEADKARAIFTWIALNIQYDLPAAGKGERQVAYSYRSEEEKLAIQKKVKLDLAIKTIRSKKGVCQGYATLFFVLAEKTGLEAAIVPGTSKSHTSQIGNGPGANDHAWNAVKINGKWKLLDATWASGVVEGIKPAFKFKFNDGYFFATPDVFFLNHYPKEDKWLLTGKTPQDFASLPLYYGNYLMGGYEFLSPQTGMLTSKKQDTVSFKIRNLKAGDTVHYAFAHERKVKEVKPVISGDIALFDVPLGTVANDILTIYINQKSVAAYKINR